MLPIGTTEPDFAAETTQGPIRFHDWIGDGWAILFSHPKSFTPVCTTELGAVARLLPEFRARQTKVIGLSVDPVQAHERWAADIETTQGHAVTYPLIGDADLHVSNLYGMLPAETQGTSEERTAATNATVRTVFIIGPDKQIKLALAYPMSTGRNFDEILRALASLRLTVANKVATPADLRPGEDVIIAGSLTDDLAREIFLGGRQADVPYLRIVPQPKAG